MLAEGTYQELRTSGLDFAKLLGSSSDGRRVDTTLDGPPKNHRQRPDKVTAAAGQHGELITENRSKTAEPAEPRSSGNVSLRVYSSYVRAGGNCRRILGLLFVCVLTQVFESAGNYWISYWYVNT